MPVAQSAVDGLRRDVDRLNQPLRVVLLSFTALKKEFLSSLKDERKLADFPRRAAPVILAALKATLPATKWCVSQLSVPAD